MKDTDETLQLPSPEMSRAEKSTDDSHHEILRVLAMADDIVINEDEKMADVNASVPLEWESSYTVMLLSDVESSLVEREEDSQIGVDSTDVIVDLSATPTLAFASCLPEGVHKSKSIASGVSDIMQTDSCSCVMVQKSMATGSCVSKVEVQQSRTSPDVEKELNIVTDDIPIGSDTSVELSASCSVENLPTSDYADEPVDLSVKQSNSASVRLAVNQSNIEPEYLSLNPSIRQSEMCWAGDRNPNELPISPIAGSDNHSADTSFISYRNAVPEPESDSEPVSDSTSIKDVPSYCESSDSIVGSDSEDLPAVCDKQSGTVNFISTNNKYGTILF